MKSRIFCLVLAALLFFGEIPLCVSAAETDQELFDIYKTTGEYLENLGVPVPGSVRGEWMVIGLARSGHEISGLNDYYENVVKYIQENIDENERLHHAKSTENSRMILALTAIGKDVTDVGGHNLIAGLNSMEFVLKQGINGPVWTLIAFDSGNYPAPTGDVTRESLIQTILEAQLEDGGWSFSGGTSDVDITAMAIQSLAPYKESNAEVSKALNKAVEALSDMQAADGSFGNAYGTSSESISQVITALSALGIDADKDERFIKNGISAVDALCTFYVEGGGFKHQLDGELDGMATEQCYYSLAAYYRLLEGRTSLYDMTDVPDSQLDEEAGTVTTESSNTQKNTGKIAWLSISAVVIAGAVIIIIANRRKTFG